MVKLRCQNCGEVTEGKKSDLDDSECDCGGNYAIMGSEDDEYEPTICSICKKEQKNDADLYTCLECNNVNVCEDCIVKFDEAGCYYCKSCVDKAYPRESKVEYKEKIVEKPVFVDREGNRLDITYRLDNKTKFD